MFSLHPSKYILIKEEDQPLPRLGYDGLRRLRKKQPMPKGWHEVEEIWGHSVLDDEGLLKNRFWTLRRHQ